MIKNYLLIAVRNLTKNFGYTAINIFGLAIGLACCLLVTLYIRFELSYENFHEKKASIYRYIPRGERDGKVSMQTMLPAGFGPLINDSFREVEKFTRFSDVDERALLRNPEQAADWVLLGQARQKAGQDKGAREAFCKAKEKGSAEGAKLCP